MRRRASWRSTSSCWRWKRSTSKVPRPTSRRCWRYCVPSSSARATCTPGLIPEVLGKEKDMTECATTLDCSGARAEAAHGARRIGRQAIAGGLRRQRAANQVISAERWSRGGRCAGLTPPLAVKVMSPDILHKSDAGGVKVGLRIRGMKFEQRFGEMMTLPAIATARIDGYLIEEMAPAGQEIVVGAVARPAVRAARHGGSGRHFRRGAGGRRVSHLPDHAPRCAKKCWRS